MPTDFTIPAPGYSAKSYALYCAKNSKLTKVLSTLPEANDTELNKFLGTRLARGNVFPGTGQITTIDLGIEPAHCYYCLLNPYNHDDSGEQFVVCFVTECNRGLDSFRTQLDQHATKIENVLRERILKPTMNKWAQYPAQMEA